MRRLLSISILFLLTINPIKADFVPVADAQATAAVLFGKNTQKSSSAISLLYVGAVGSDTVYYVFGQADGGFAIVAADDAVNPVLGFSHTSPAGEPIENKMLMRQLDRYAQKIVMVRQQDAVSSANKRNWRAYADSIPTADSVPTIDSTQVIDTVVVSDSIITVGPLLTSAWSQTDAYNDSCPTYAGCVAVAMGQVMRYHQWPITGRGWHKYIPSESPEIGQQFANFGATTYNWSLMPDKLRPHHSSAEKSAVAQLLYHAGVAVDMSYTKDGSGSYTCDVLYAMPQYFRYSDSIRLCTYSDYDNEQWYRMIKSEIDAGRPVIYSGATLNNEGHAWVVDGYNSKGYLHVNWGWGGDYDGFFLPDGMILETSHFDRELDAIIGIVPADSTPLMWTLQSTRFSKNRGIQNISAVNELVVWASAYDGIISNGQCMDFCRTIDGGESWQSGTVNIPKNESYTISSISAVSATEAWASVYVSVNSNTLTGGKIAHTADGGKTWNIQPTATFNGKSAFPNAVHFWNSSDGVCVGDPNGGYFEIYTTTDGGNQWTRVPASRIPAYNRNEAGEVGSFYVCGNVVFFGTNKGRLFRSVDRGATWTVVQTPFSGIFRMAFRNNSTGIISGSLSRKTAIFRTTNGGTDWERVQPDSCFYTSDFAYIPDSDTLISVGRSSDGLSWGLSYSVDEGITFTNFANLYADIDQFTAVGIAPNGRGMWAGAVNYGEHYGGMWHRGMTEPILKSTPIAAVQATVETILLYPNPTTDFVTIECESPITNVDVISPQGIVVKHVTVNFGKCQLSVSNLPGGVYLVRTTMGNGAVVFGRFVKR